MYVAIPQVSQCCCGMSLIAGSQIIAGYTLLCGWLVIGAAIYEMTSGKLEASTMEVPITHKLDLIYYYVGLIFLLLVGVSLVLCSVLLLYAIVKEKYSYVLPYFAIVAVVQIMDVGGFIFFFVKLFSDFGLSSVFLTCIILNAGVMLYCFLVVYSFYRDVTWSSVT